MKSYDFEFENFEDYFGGVEEVQYRMNLCDSCGTKVNFKHIPDYQNLILKESSKCPKCGRKSHFKVHQIN